MKHTQRRRRTSFAFTLLEIMLVVIIIALLLGAAVVAFQGNLGIAEDARLKGDIQAISNGMKLYQATNGFYPGSEQGVRALVTRPEGEPRPKQWHKLLEQVPLDPWKQEYVYVQPGRKNPDSFDVYSKGRDLKADTADDVGNWEQ